MPAGGCTDVEDDRWLADCCPCVNPTEEIAVNISNIVATVSKADAIPVFIQNERQ
jgi:hypothetical protein